MVDDCTDRERFHSIDAIRGFCLVNIFVNHITIGALRNVSPSQIFFFDSADVFVFLAGISCFLAFGKLSQKTQFTTRIWHRASILYITNAMLAVISISILIFFEKAHPGSGLIDRPDLLIAEHGAGTYAWHLLSLQQDVGYTVVLRLYVALMVIAPLYVMLAKVRFWLPLVPAGIVWIFAGHLGWTEYNSLTGIERSMTILPWNFIFAAGVCLGAGFRAGCSLRGGSTMIMFAAALVLAGPFCLALVPHLSSDALTWVNMRNDFFWTGASKSLQSPLRVTSLLAAAYLFIVLRRALIVRLVHGVSKNNAFVVLGRRSLEVFTMGAVLALVVERLLLAIQNGDTLVTGTPEALVLEIVLCGGAIWAMVLAARSKWFSVKRIEQYAISKHARSFIAMTSPPTVSE